MHANPLIEHEKKVLDRFKPNGYFGKNPDGLLAGQSKTISSLRPPSLKERFFKASFDEG